MKLRITGLFALSTAVLVLGMITTARETLIKLSAFHNWSG